MPLQLTRNPGACLVKTCPPPPVMLEVEKEAVPVVAVAVVEVVAVVVAKVVEVEVTVMEEVEVTVMEMTTTMKIILHLWIVWAPQDVDVCNEPIGSSMMPRCNSSRHKSYKMNAKQLWVDALRVSKPPTPSRRPTKTDNDPL